MTFDEAIKFELFSLGKNHNPGMAYYMFFHEKSQPGNIYEKKEKDQDNDKRGIKKKFLLSV